MGATRASRRRRLSKVLLLGPFAMWFCARTDVSTRLDFFAFSGSCTSGGWAQNPRRGGGLCKIRCASHLLSTSAAFTTSMSSHGSDMASTHTIFNWTTNFDRTALACAHAPCQPPWLFLIALAPFSRWAGVYVRVSNAKPALWP